MAQEMASQEAEATTIDFGVDGFPVVPRFSSLLTFLELCKPGAIIESSTLDARIVKTDKEGWIYEEEELSSRQIVTEIRFREREDDPSLSSAAVDNMFACIEPLDVSVVHLVESEPTIAEPNGNGL